MNIRNLELKDLITVESIHKEVSEFPLPNVNSSMYPVQKVIEVEGKIVGSAFVQITTEISLSLIEELDRITKAKINLFSTLLHELSSLGFEDTHVFVLPKSDSQYAEFLIKHFEFVRAQGIPLYLRPNVKSR